MLCVQICPAPEDLNCTIVQRPSTNPEDRMPCARCQGTGRVKERPCKKCDGTGEGLFIWCARLYPKPSEYEEVREYLKKLGPDYRIDVTIGLSEVGGGHTNTGHATIVCGLKGEKLPSVHGYPKCGEAHAIFWVHAALVIEYSHHRGVGEGKVKLVAVDRRVPFNVGIEEVPLWSFDDREIRVLNPKYLRHNYENDTLDLHFPEEAVEAAKNKARDYHCRSAYYADGYKAQGPSGALRGAGAAFGGLPSPLKGPGIGY